VIGSTDGSVLPRHDGLGALLSASVDPAPRKTRRIEWVGEFNPLDLPFVAFATLRGQTFFTDEQKRLIRRMAARARTRGYRNRLMEHDHQHAMCAVKGLQRTYQWTRENGYVCDVDYADVDRILGSDVGHEFVDLDSLQPGEKAEPRIPPSFLRFVGALTEGPERPLMVSSRVIATGGAKG
jgi:hypothetical protein